MATRPSIFAVFSFLPAVGYAIFDWYYPPHIAAALGLGLGVLELLLEKILTHHLHALSKINFSLLTLLAALTWYARDGFWFKLQPALGSLGLALILIWWGWKKQGVFLQMMEDLPLRPNARENLKRVPPILWQAWERDLIIFLLVYAGVMFLLATMNARLWAVGKTVGLYVATALWGGAEIFLFRWRWKKYLQREMAAAMAVRPSPHRF